MSATSMPQQACASCLPHPSRGNTSVASSRVPIRVETTHLPIPIGKLSDHLLRSRVSSSTLTTMPLRKHSEPRGSTWRACVEMKTERQVPAPPSYPPMITSRLRRRCSHPGAKRTALYLSLPLCPIAVGQLRPRQPAPAADTRFNAAARSYPPESWQIAPDRVPGTPL